MTAHSFDAVVFGLGRAVKRIPFLQASSVEFIEDLKEKGISVGTVFFSDSSAMALKLSGMENLFDFRAKRVSEIAFTPGRSVAVESSPDGVKAARDAGLGLIVGLAGGPKGEELFASGADILVSDPGKIDFDRIEGWFHRKPRRLFSYWDNRSAAPESSVNPRYSASVKESILSGRKVVFVFDYDGTLTPVVKHPDLAVMPEDVRDAVRRISERYVTVIMSGRARKNIEELAGIKDIFYAGNHGFEIGGPGLAVVYPAAEKTALLMKKASAGLRKRLKKVPGLVMEEKGYSASVHYRLAEERFLAAIQEAVKGVVKGESALRLMQGKKVYEIVPAIEWDKGKAVRWILENLGLSWDDSSVVYIGDDTTDEDAFRTIRARGTGILIAEEERASAADFYAISMEEVKETLEKLIKA